MLFRSAGVAPPITVPLIVPPVIVAVPVESEFNVAKPDVDNVVNAPVEGVALPIGVLLMFVAVVAPSVVAAALNAPSVVAPVTPSVPPTVALFVTDAELSVAKPDDDNVVNAPVDAVPAPIGVLLIEPPVIVAFAVVSEFRVAKADDDNEVNEPVEPEIGVPEIVPPEITAFDVVNEVLAVKFVNVPAAGVAPPITVLLIVPPVIVADPVVNDAAFVAPSVEAPAFKIGRAHV